ncbi:hypothetical protein UlMin_013975 [Ulmus minor]
MWDELKDFRPIPACNCGGMKALLDYQQHEYVMQFLMGLNEYYTKIRAQILMQDPLPSINKVFSLAVQEERQRSLTHLNYDSVACNATSGSYGQYSRSYKGRFEKFVCSHCGIQGHVVDRCYKFHGYPPGFKVKPIPLFTNSKLVVNQTGVICDQYDVPASSENVPSHLSGFNSTLSSSQCQQLIAFLSSQLQGSTQSSPALGNSNSSQPNWISFCLYCANAFE